MSGNHNSQQIADTIYNLDKPNINALENSESWEKLIACFSEESAQRVAKNITDPRMQKHMKTHNGPGEIKWLKGKFKNVPMYEEDPRANTFVAIQTKALADLDSFINTKDEEAFLKAWASHREALLSISTKDK